MEQQLRCRECGYRLEHAERGACPECGAGFDRHDRWSVWVSPCDDALKLIGGTKIARLVFLAGVCLLILSEAIRSPLCFWLGWLDVMVSMVVTFIYQTRAARCMFGWFYAIRHLILGLLLTPLLFLGVMLVPMLVERDIRRAMRQA